MVYNTVIQQKASIGLPISAFIARAAVVHWNIRAGSTFPVPVCTVPHRNWVNKADNQQNQPEQ